MPVSLCNAGTVCDDVITQRSHKRTPLAQRAAGQNWLRLRGGLNVVEEVLGTAQSCESHLIKWYAFNENG